MTGDKMSENKKTGGSCLCGEVSYQFNGPINLFQYCHCSRCQKFTGSAHASNIYIDPANFQWLSGEDQIGRFEHPEAKHFATCFCKQCGSALPWITKTGKVVIVPAGTLNDDPGEKPIQSVYYADRACWYEEVGKLKKFDELPPRKK